MQRRMGLWKQLAWHCRRSDGKFSLRYHIYSCLRHIATSSCSFDEASAFRAYFGSDLIIKKQSILLSQLIWSHVRVRGSCGDLYFPYCLYQVDGASGSVISLFFAEAGLIFGSCRYTNRVYGILLLSVRKSLCADASLVLSKGMRSLLKPKQNQWSCFSKTLVWRLCGD